MTAGPGVRPAAMHRRAGSTSEAGMRGRCGRRSGRQPGDQRRAEGRGRRRPAGRSGRGRCGQSRRCCPQQRHRPVRQGLLGDQRCADDVSAIRGNAPGSGRRRRMVPRLLPPETPLVTRLLAATSASLGSRRSCCGCRRSSSPRPGRHCRSCRRTTWRWPGSS